MRITPRGLLQDNAVKTALKSAWDDSSPGIVGGHEEGGFVLQSPDGGIFVQRWPFGQHNRISVPWHHNCRIGENDILASFHTHPNTGTPNVRWKWSGCLGKSLNIDTELATQKQFEQMAGHFCGDMSSQSQNRLAQKAFQIASSVLDFIKDT
jgi:hypothetical protein